VARGPIATSGLSTIAAMVTTETRREELKEVFTEARGCTRCPQLAATRTQVVFGAGNADADLMFVGEAPGAREDERGLPFVGAAGKMLEELLAGVGMQRDDVFIANVLKCRPPGNRDPAPVEIENCQQYLFRQVELIRPKVICTLGNFSTKLLRADPTGITRLHGRPEIRVVGTRAVRLYPIHHPAAALYTRSLQDTLREDFARLPGLLELPEPDQPQLEPAVAVAPDLVEGRPGVEEEPVANEDDPEDREDPGAEQLGLF
jgi:uracil-DNA glycosylase family 4